jgi:hypothetical protein
MISITILNTKIIMRLRLYPDEVEYIDGNQLSDKWFPVIIEN